MKFETQPKKTVNWALTGVPECMQRKGKINLFLYIMHPKIVHNFHI